MPDISAWLQGLGLGKYAAVFEEHEIDFDALPHLTEAMLEKLGLPIGPRAKLLAAISQLVLHSRKNQHSGEPARLRQEERRQITVMFCDLVDSTKLAEILDPEDLGFVIRAYQRACGGIIARYGGRVARYFGDGIMAYFGWPAAHEDAAERAVRAGLEVVEAVKHLASPEKLLVRVGVSTGIVVIGEQGPGDPAELADAVGGAPYVAARLQNLATPNSVVIAEATSRLVSGRFDQEDLGLQNLKGLTQPVQVFRIQRVRDDSSRFQAVHTKALTPLVGRQAELAFLQQRWHDAKGGDGQVMFVSGVPGIGKSRIVHEVEKSIQGEPHCSLRFQCFPHCMQSPLFPITQQIKSLADLASEDTLEVKLDKIERLVGLATEQIDRVGPFLAVLLSVPTESRYAPFALTAQQVKDQTLFILVELLLGLAAKGPVFCLVEDAHWIDPSTQELLDLVVSQIETARILLVVTHRPEYALRSTMQSNVSGLTLSRLGRGEVAEMTRLALRHQTVSSTAVERIIDESDAIPLFVEELARGVIERGGINGHGTNGQSTKLSASWSVPESLRDSLVARLDRAPQARNVAQMAAVMGREFSYDMLLQISSLTNSELDAALSHLRQTEIVQLIDNRPLPRYAFKHALVRDAAYESLLKSSRREIHARVCAIIEKDRPDIVADQPELLAYHYSLAGDAESAVRYWLLGGKRARSRSANLEAAGQLRRALEILELLPNTLERMRTKLEIHLLLGLCFIAVRGYQADDTRNSFEVARGLSAELADPHKEFQAIYGLWGHHWMRAYHDRAIELSETLVAKAQSLNEPITLIVGHRCLGSTLFTLGDFVKAKEHLERAIALRVRLESHQERASLRSRSIVEAA